MLIDQHEAKLIGRAITLFCFAVVAAAIGLLVWMFW